MHSIVTTIDPSLTMLPCFVVWYYAQTFANEGSNWLMMLTGVVPRVHFNIKPPLQSWQNSWSLPPLICFHVDEVYIKALLLLQLLYLDLSGNRFSGTLPSSWSYCQVSNFSLGSNFVRSCLPATSVHIVLWQEHVTILLTFSDCCRTWKLCG